MVNILALMKYGAYNKMATRLRADPSAATSDRGSRTFLEAGHCPQWILSFQLI